MSDLKHEWCTLFLIVAAIAAFHGIIPSEFGLPFLAHTGWCMWNKRGIYA